MTPPWASAQHWPRLLALGVALAWTDCAAGSGPQAFTFDRLNQTYQDLPVRPGPSDWGPFHIQLSVPRSTFTLIRHLLRLRPGGGRSHDFELEAEFSGSGRAVAEIEGLGIETQRADRLFVPRQVRSVRGKIRIERTREGYLVTALQLPPEMRVTIQSALAGELVDWCEGSSLFRLVGVDCGGLRKTLSEVPISLPRPGEAYLLAYGDLTAEERRRLDRYLEDPRHP